MLTTSLFYHSYHKTRLFGHGGRDPEVPNEDLRPIHKDPIARKVLRALHELETTPEQINSMAHSIQPFIRSNVFTKNTSPILDQENLS